MDIAEILKKLREPVDPKWIEQKPVFEKGKRSSTVPYLPWQSVVELLNERIGLGCWQWTVDDVVTSEKLCFVRGTLTIYGVDRILDFGGAGSEELDVSGYGDPIGNSEAQALRRAAAKAGLGWELYQKPKKALHRQPAAYPSARPSVTPHPLRNRNPVTMAASKKWDIPTEQVRVMLQSLKNLGVLPNEQSEQLEWVNESVLPQVQEILNVNYGTLSSAPDQ